MPTPREKFQGLLCELFQFDSADLDFGIYRIMNHKRAMIENFIKKDLLDTVSAELSTGAIREEGDLARRLDEARAAIREHLGADHLDGDGNLIKGHDTKLGREYIELQERAGGARSRAASETLVFNHLYQFFSRYYDRGDFFSLRHYSRQQKYAVPYNGEEVYLHWANKDQYYVKTGEYFTNYRWQAGSGEQRVTILFRLTEAVVEKGNIKAPETRYFLPQTNALGWNAASCTLTLPMHWRGLLTEEETRFGTKNVQDAIVDAALTDIEKHPLLKDNPELKTALLAPQTGPDGQPRVNGKATPISRLRHHLSRYTRRNTSDFFVHKDLSGFLTRELDFYLKNEVLHLDDLEKGGLAQADSWFQLVRAIRAIGSKIIAFLAQIEDFQKRLFEKKKFVTECHYAITLDRVPEALYAEIAANNAQREEWVNLCAIDEIERDTTQPGYSVPLKVDFLKAHEFLMVDTRHFDPCFKDRLLAAMPKLDEQTDGVLINSENFHALHLIQERYRRSVQLAYVDPPYNTGEDGFLYKDTYQHASWISYICTAFASLAPLISEKGIVTTSIDDTEYKHLWYALSSVFGSENYLGSFVWKRRSSSGLSAKPLSLDHEYVLTFGTNAALSKLHGLEKKPEDYPMIDPKTGKHYASTDLTIAATKEERPGQYFAIKNPRTGREFWPSGNRVWRFFPDTMQEVIANELVIWPDEAEGNLERPRYKTFYDPDGDNTKPCSSWLENSNTNDREIEAEETEYLVEILQTGMNQEGGRQVERLFGRKAFAYPKPVSLVRSFVRAATRDEELCIDPVAGSGTTAHAVISLNREDEHRRKYVLIEMGEYFDSVLVPRLKKVVYARDWKEGSPLNRSTGISQCIKMLWLEGYEDSLGNIAFPSEEQGQAMMALEGYKLCYMLDFETRESATFLDVDQLRSPFRYTLDIRDGDEVRRQKVDLPETFSYLIGLIVERHTVHEHKAGRQTHHYLLYRGKTRESGIPTAVLWRDIEGWKEDDFQREKGWLASENLLDGADRIYVNGTSTIENAESLDPLFKRLLFAGTTAATS